MKKEKQTEILQEKAFFDSIGIQTRCGKKEPTYSVSFHAIVKGIMADCAEILATAEQLGGGNWNYAKGYEIGRRLDIAARMRKRLHLPADVDVSLSGLSAYMAEGGKFDFLLSGWLGFKDISVLKMISESDGLERFPSGEQLRSVASKLQAITEES